MPPAKSNDIPNLDFLRAGAVLFVLVDHTLNALGVHRIWKADLNWLGRTGVLFFFVHTCCVLMMSLERHKGKRFFSNFYLRRAFRIYPLSMIAVLLAMVPPYAPRLSPLAWLSNLALTQDLTFSGNAFESIWSLPLEVQMYFFLPFIFLLARRRKSLWPLLALFAASVPIALWLPQHIGRAKVIAFVPAFLPGVIAYWLFRNGKQMLPPWGLPLAIASITTAFLLHPGWKFPAWLACLALGLCVPLFRQIPNRMVNKASFNIAKYSYGIYLSHSLLLTWMQPTWRSLPLYLCAVVAASVAAYHLIEHPMIRLGQGVTTNHPSSAKRMAAHKLA